MLKPLLLAFFFADFAMLSYRGADFKSLILGFSRQEKSLAIVSLVYTFKEMLLKEW